MADRFKAYIEKIIGYDPEFTKYEPKRGILKANINAVLADVYIGNLNEDSKISLVWKLEGEDLYSSNDLSCQGKNRYGGGIIINEGYLPTGRYSCQLMEGNTKLDSIYFNIEQKDFKTIKLKSTVKNSESQIEVGGGLTIFEIVKNCTHYCCFTILNDRGDKIEKLYEGDNYGTIRRALFLTSGKYILDMAGDKNWRCTISQPRNMKPKTLPCLFENQVSDISGLFYLEGRIEIKYSYYGRGEFIIEILSVNSQKRQIMVNKRGRTAGSVCFEGASESYLLAVCASGQYHILIQEGCLYK